MGGATGRQGERGRKTPASLSLSPLVSSSSPAGRLVTLRFSMSFKHKLQPVSSSARPLLLLHPPYGSPAGSHQGSSPVSPGSPGLSSGSPPGSPASARGSSPGSPPGLISGTSFSSL